MLSVLSVRSTITKKCLLGWLIFEFLPPFAKRAKVHSEKVIYVDVLKLEPLFALIPTFSTSCELRVTSSTLLVLGVDIVLSRLQLDMRMGRGLQQ